MPPLAMVSAINVLSKAVSRDSLSVHVQIRFCGYFKVSHIVIGIHRTLESSKLFISQLKSLFSFIVPTWSWSRSDLSKEDGIDLASVEEDTSDEAFHKRHHKLETDEKRRKR